MSQRRGKRLKTVKKWLRSDQYSSRLLAICFVVVFAGLGIYFLTSSHAQSPFASGEAEAGSLGTGASLIADANASSGTAVKFGGVTSGSANCPGLANAAFCDNFNNPTTNPTGSRSGALNGNIWGVSRGSGTGGNPWYIPNTLYAIDDGTQTAPAPCNNIVTVAVPNDVAICNGQLHENFNDGIAVASLTMYPKQPFDFAGRTGKVVFDVSNNSQGSHGAWPEFWMTDQPVPNPFTHEFSWVSYPRNGFGIRFAGPLKL